LGEDRNLSIDFIKGILILLVVIGHTVPQESILTKLIYFFHMPLFLGIFGYLIKNYNFEYNNYYYMKIKRLLIPFFTGSMIYFILSHIFYYQNLFTSDTLKSFAYILIIPSFAHLHLWYLYSTAIQFTLLYTLYKTHSLNAKLELALLFFFLFCGIIINYTIPLEEILEFKRTFGWFIFTFTGFLLSNKIIPYYYDLLCIRRKAHVLIFLTIIYLIFSFIFPTLFISKDDGLLSSLFFIINNFLLIIIIIFIANENTKFNIPIINYIGANSMIVYLFHPLLRLFGIIILNIKETQYFLLIFFSTFMCFPIIWAVNKSNIIKFLLVGDNKLKQKI
jgi:acyltransferase